MMLTIPSLWEKIPSLYKRAVVFCLGVSVIIGAGLLVRQWNIRTREQRAQKIFSDSMQVYNQALSLDFAPEEKRKYQQDLWKDSEI